MTDHATPIRPQVQPMIHELSTPELALSLQSIRTVNHDHASLAIEAALRLIALVEANHRLIGERDNLKGQNRILTNRVDEMRRSMVDMNQRMEQLRDRANELDPRAPLQLPTPARFSRMPPRLVDKITQTIGQASMCWENPAAAGEFKRDRAHQLAHNLVDAIANELELATLSRRPGDDNTDWQRRALEAELDRDSMRLGIFHASLEREERRLIDDEAAAIEASREAWRQLRAELAALRDRIASRIRRLFKRT